VTRLRGRRSRATDAKPGGLVVPPVDEPAQIVRR
jgi:hypothetical protein